MTSPNSLRDLFEAATALEPAERAAFLDRCCSDPDERARLERLLAADAHEGDPWSHPSSERLAEAIGDNGDDAFAWTPGTRIGAYELIEILGEGGSSTVFRAVRDLDGVRQDVALKLLHRGLYSPEAQRAFRRERQALAALSHPNIAHLIDGGVTEAGIPYLVVEYIDGLPITQYAEEQRLDLRARLQLMVVVCRAVDAAHRRLIVHRDLKPSNILVAADGRVKLLDFGIAKLLDAELGDAAGATRSGYAPLTPGYAAPEQYGGGPVSTATDVFALGVVLHELLLGERPVQRPAPRPSARAGELTDEAGLPAPCSALRTLLRGDLDNVVLKALAEEPERRYPGAAELGEDLERHLGARPVRAHPPSRWYRTRKFVQRHRGGVMLTAAFAIGLIASLALAFWQAHIAREQAARAAEQTRIAQRQTQRAEAVRDLLVGLFDAEIPRGPRDEMPDTAELLERGAERALTELDGTPAVQSELLTALGRVYDHLARPDKGEPLLDAAIAAARRVQPEDPALLGAALSERGELELTRNRFADAIALFEQALPLQRQADPEDLALAITLDRHALALSFTGEHDRALAGYEAALAIRRARFADGSPEILHSQHAIGTALYRAGRHPEAEPLLQRAAEGARAYFGDRHVKTAHYLKNQASNLMAMRRYREAAAPLASAVEIERSLYPPASPDIVQGLHALANLDLLLGQPMPARTRFEECERRNREGGMAPSLGQSFVLGNLARTLDVLGETAAATAALQRAEAMAREVVGDAHPRTRSLQLTRMRRALAEDPGSAAALAAFARELLADVDSLGQFRARTEPEARYALALAMATQGDMAGAAAEIDTALASLPGQPVDPLLLYIVAGSAEWLSRQNRNSEAVPLLRDQIARARQAFPDGHFAVAELQLTLAELLRTSDPSTASDLAQEARDALAALPVSHPWHARAERIR